MRRMEAVAQVPGQWDATHPRGKAPKQVAFIELV
jgi:hypothetical protein